MCERLLYIQHDNHDGSGEFYHLYPLVVVDTVAAITHESEHDR